MNWWHSLMVWVDSTGTWQSFMIGFLATLMIAYNFGKLWEE